MEGRELRVVRLSDGQEPADKFRRSHLEGIMIQISTLPEEMLFSFDVQSSISTNI